MVTDAEWARVFAAFGPHVPDGASWGDASATRPSDRQGWLRCAKLDLLGALPGITAPTLVVVGERDPITPVAAAEEILSGLAPGIGRLEVIEGAGHFIWLDRPDRLWPVVTAFTASASNAP